jgi:ATP-binding cassette subfamily F protein uup
MLDRFLFPPSQQYMKVEKLSGGEKRRLYLLRVLMSAPNVLILDEPTNDLDIRTMTILEDYLDRFAGIVITVSHDRYFLDRVVNRIFAFEGNGTITQYEGGYTDYQVKFLNKHHYISAQSFSAAGSIARTGVLSGSSLDTSSMTDSGNSTSVSGRDRHQLRMSYKEAREWESIESEIEALEEQIQTTEQEILHYANDFIRLNELSSQKEDLENQLAKKMERWEYLSELDEKIRNQNS